MARDSWLKRLIWLRGSPAGGSGASYEKTVGPAPIISISDAKAKPAKSLIVGMEPIQDLHGYDSPWPAGGGKNLLMLSTDSKTGTVDGVTYSYNPDTEKITLSGTNNNSSAHMLTTFSPSSTGFAIPSFAAGETYTLSCMLPSTMYAQFAYKNVDNVNRQMGYIVGSGALSSVTFTIPNDYDHIYQFQIYVGGIATALSGEIYFELVAGSTAPTSWTPYSNICPITGRTGANIYRYAEYDADAQPTYIIQLGQTVYGGTVDVVSGLLTVTRGYSELDENWAWVKSGTYQGGYYANRWVQMGYKISTPFFCSHAKSVDSLSKYVNGTCYCDSSINIRIMDANSTLQDWEDYIVAQRNNGTPITICYELAEPLTYQLTPQQIQMLKGANVLWSDADDLTLTYIGTTPANLLGGMLGGGLGGGYNPPAEQDPDELTEPEATETDEPAEETPAEEGENNGE